MRGHLAARRAAALLAQQAALQAAAQLVIDLDLLAVLGRVGHARLIGSAATGLMVWRDVDVQVLAPGLAARDAWQAVAPLAAHPQMTEVRFLNQAGPTRRARAHRDSRYYVQLCYRTAAAPA